MKNINVEIFLKEWNKIEEKLDAIRGLVPLFTSLKDFEGVEISDSGITYKTSEYYSGCGTETDSFHVTWEDINKPIEHFRLLCDNAKIAKQNQELQAKQENEGRRIEQEKQQLKELQKKYGNLP